MYGIYANIGGILMVNVIIYTIHGSYGFQQWCEFVILQVAFCQSLGFCQQFSILADGYQPTWWRTTHGS